MSLRIKKNFWRKSKKLNTYNFENINKIILLHHNFKIK